MNRPIRHAPQRPPAFIHHSPFDILYSSLPLPLARKKKETKRSQKTPLATSSDRFAAENEPKTNPPQP